MRPLVYIQPSNGIMTSQHHIYYATSAQRVAGVSDAFESDRIEWMPLAKIYSLIAEHKIVGGTTMAALLYATSTVSMDGRSP